MRQAARGQSLAAEQQRDHAGLARFPEYGIYFVQGLGNCAALGQGSFGLRRWRSPRCPRAQQDRNGQQDQKRNIRAGRYQPAQPAKYPVHGLPSSQGVGGASPDTQATQRWASSLGIDQLNVEVSERPQPSFLRTAGISLTRAHRFLLSATTARWAGKVITGKFSGH